MSSSNPPLIVSVRRTSGRVEADWETQGEICLSDIKKCPQIRVFKNGGALEGQPPVSGHVLKYISLKEFLELNPLWTERARQLCEIVHISFPN